MTKQEKKIIEDWLDNSSNYINIEYGLDNVCMDGWFNFETLIEKLNNLTKDKE